MNNRPLINKLSVFPRVLKSGRELHRQAIKRQNKNFFFLVNKICALLLKLELKIELI